MIGRMQTADCLVQSHCTHPLAQRDGDRQLVSRRAITFQLTNSISVIRHVDCCTAYRALEKNRSASRQTLIAASASHHGVTWKPPSVPHVHPPVSCWCSHALSRITISQHAMSI